MKKRPGCSGKKPHPFNKLFIPEKAGKMRWVRGNKALQEKSYGRQPIRWALLLFPFCRKEVRFTEVRFLGAKALAREKTGERKHTCGGPSHHCL